ncbi:carboxymuconolactone decarboxylase family protein [Cupriavidus sp. IK-TO18]|uniref:carboxymuconolactone decarboxylase family protein n=1 Tax=Cupriavidus sp. IK-TO18 TaxID=2782182 RepID=UPI00189A43E0|nr:carboxymuconolactone decarboxylase family protein [Cupriavidus sp. IK-TO18]MBF6989442.1 carboxymuconolactone decarboxylase family protein [Cupriavidus sp. IK-TO18]
MTRLNAVAPEQASGAVKELYDAIRQAVGAVPNIHRGIANSPTALQSFLQLDSSLNDSQLGTLNQEAIALAVSQVYDCKYCLAAHTLLAKNAGLSEVETIEIRRGTSKRPGLEALVQFVIRAIRPDGRISDEDVAAVKVAGFSDAQITEALLKAAQTVFANVFQRVHQAPVDFPAAPSL